MTIDQTAALAAEKAPGVRRPAGASVAHKAPAVFTRVLDGARSRRKAGTAMRPGQEAGKVRAKTGPPASQGAQANVMSASFGAARSLVASAAGPEVRGLSAGQSGAEAKGRSDRPTRAVKTVGALAGEEKNAVGRAVLVTGSKAASKTVPTPIVHTAEAASKAPSPASRARRATDRTAVPTALAAQKPATVKASVPVKAP